MPVIGRVVEAVELEIQLRHERSHAFEGTAEIAVFEGLESLLGDEPRERQPFSIGDLLHRLRMRRRTFSNRFHASEAYSEPSGTAGTPIS